MPWYMPCLMPISEYVKKKMCIYLLQRYLGQFFEEKLTLDQLSLDVYNGTGIVRNVSLDVQALNDLGEKQNWPLEFIDGYLEHLHVSVPWTSLLSESTCLEVTGLKITVQPKQQHESATSVFESMWSSMTSSMQLVKDYIKQEPNVADDSKSFEGLEKFAQTIDSVLTRIKIKFIDTVIQVEHVPKDSLTGVALQIHFGIIDYSDEAGSDPSANDEPLPQDQGKAYVVSSYATKLLHLDNVTFHTMEFPSASRTFSRSIVIEKEQSQDIFDGTAKRDMDSKDELNNPDSIDVNQEDQASFSTTETADSSNYNNGRHAVIFGKLIGNQEIRIRLKHSEIVSGSKVSLEMNLGGLIMFLTPRQVHVLSDLANGISRPHLEDNSNIPAKQKCIEKPMTSLDYQRVEKDLQDQVHPNIGFTGLQGMYGWSKGKNDTNDVFHSMKNSEPSSRDTSNFMFDSADSNDSGSMDSSLNTSIVSSASEFTHSRRRGNIENDSSAEVTNFQIRIASISVVLLHEDILSLTYDDRSQIQDLVPSTVQLLKTTAERFFNTLIAYNLTAYGNNSFDDNKQIFERACRLNHMRLIAAPIQVEAREATTLSAFSVSGKLTIAKLELLECLYNDSSKISPSLVPSGTSTTTQSNIVQYVRLLYFAEDSNITSPSNSIIKPCVKLTFKHMGKHIDDGLKGNSYMPKTELGLKLNICYVELDITIIERISALLNGAPVCVSKNPIDVWTPHSQPSVETITDSRLDFVINSPETTIKLRFPLADLRPKHDMNRRPWWQRDVRADYLTICMRDASADTIFSTTLITQKYGIHCKEIVICYHETEDSLPVSIGKITSSTNSESEQQWISFEIDVRSKDTSVPDTVSDVDPMMQSTYPELKVDNSGPFSSTRIMHESDTPHSKLHQDDSEEIIIPGDRSEMHTFITETGATSRIAITMNLPTVYLDIGGKNMYEVLYNRINSDLLLWESSAPEILWPRSTTRPYRNYYERKDNEWFGMCKSGIQYDSDSDASSDDCDPDNDNIFESVYESQSRFTDFRSSLMDKSHKHLKEGHHDNTNNTSKQSEFTLHIIIGNGKVLLSPSAWNQSPPTTVLPSLIGELQCIVEKGGSIFSVTGYAGDPNLSYVCVQIADAQLLHCDILKVSHPTLPVDRSLDRSNIQLHPTVYKSDPGILSNSKDDGRQRDMVSVAVKIQANHETHYVKTVRVALGINKATLKHRKCLEPNTWITQIIDFFNILDYAVPGYTAKDVLTELHLHLWDCAIDYRPLNLDVWAIVTMESFSMSSHLSPKSNTSTLRFIAQECQLHLSDRTPKTKRSTGTSCKSNARIHLIRDYIPVVDIKLFELSLRTNDKNSGINPHINLRASNNIVNIHTCSDSAKALIELMTYFAQDGDLTTAENEDLPIESNVTNDQVHDFKTSSVNLCEDIIKTGEDSLVLNSEVQNISKLSISQHQQVNDMLGDAMRDCVAAETAASTLEGKAGRGAEMFYFPDEGQILPTITKPPPLVTGDLGDVTFRRNKSNDTDDEFCIIGEDTSLGMVAKMNVPSVHWLTDSPLIIIDNYFSVPIGKTDVLKRPKSYPVPIMEYTLREMSIVWFMYGGYDFPSSAPSSNTDSDKTTTGHKVSFKDPRIEPNPKIGSVAFSNARTGEVILMSSEKFREENSKVKTEQVKSNGSSPGNLSRAGKGRNSEVLIELQLSKIKFLHEVYPENGLQASRQVLAINDVEIRDRLKSSNINKFLYQYISEAKPKQSHAHMVVVKAAHIRPDPKLKTQECSLKVSLLPLRLNIDQDSLLFLMTFFGEISGNVSNTDDKVTSKQSTPTHHPPVMTVSDDNDTELKKQAQKLVDENLLILLEEDDSLTANTEKNICIKEAECGSFIYFRTIIFHPEVPIRLDYTGKRLDMSHGSLPGLLMGLAQLNCSELRLKRLSYRHGLLGIEKLVSYCLQEWLMEIKRHQLPSLLGGVGPMHSLIMLAQGIIDLVRLPIEQYQKDGRIVRGLQRGATSFTTSTAMAALELTSRLIYLIQITAETAYDMMSPGPSVRRRRQHSNRHGVQRRRRQPEDIRAGAVMAYNVIRQGIEETALNIIQDASHEHEQKGMSGVVGGILRQIPPNVIVKPIILASEATTNLLGGVQSQLVPDAKREANEKWKGDDR